jgi:diaminopimelate decarboxylase
LGGELRCDGVSLQEAAERFGTPLYVYSRAAVEEAYRAYDRAFAPVPHRIHYALKANSSLGLLRILRELGAGVDVVSGFELLAARRAGFAAADVVFAGVGKTDAEIVLGLEHGIAHFNAESEEEIRRIAQAAERRGLAAPVSLRVNPDIDPRSHPYISTGLRENKFGVDIEEAPEILARVRELRGVRLAGLQCHIGSQITELAPMGQAARALSRLSRQLLASGFGLEMLDLGGGLGVAYEGGETLGPEALAREILPALEGLPLTLLLEPGRSLVASAGVLLTRVLYVKESRRKRFVIVDAGMNDLLRPALYAAHHRIEPVARPGRRRGRVDIVGPVCETGDFLARGRQLPEVAAGELLAVLDSGAYAFAMASNYNLRPRGAEVLVEEGGLRLIRRRETFEDLVRTEIAQGSVDRPRSTQWRSV